MQIRDPSLPTRPLVGVYCGAELPFTEFNSTFNQLYVRFESNHSGFVASYSVVGMS